MLNVYQKDIHTELDELTFNDIYRRLQMMAMSVYDWTGLPNGIESRHIERFLFYYGRCIFFKDEDKGWMIAKCSDVGPLNYYDESTAIRPFATNYFCKQEKSFYPGDDCVVIYNNPLKTPTELTTRLYAQRLTEIQRTSDINIIAQKTPVIITGTEKQRLSLKAVIRAWRGNEPLIHGDKTIEGMQLKTLNTAAPIVFDKLNIEKRNIWNEYMTFLGIDNANQDKRERLVADEVNANNEQVELCAATMTAEREKAAAKMSLLMGSEIRVIRKNAPRKDTEVENDC